MKNFDHFKLIIFLKYQGIKKEGKKCKQPKRKELQAVTLF